MKPYISSNHQRIINLQFSDRPSVPLSFLSEIEAPTTGRSIEVYRHLFQIEQNILNIALLTYSLSGLQALSLPIDTQTKQIQHNLNIIPKKVMLFFSGFHHMLAFTGIRQQTDLRHKACVSRIKILLSPTKSIKTDSQVILLSTKRII